MFDEKGNLIPNYPDPQVLDTGSFQSAPISVSTLTQDQKPLNVIPPVVVPPPEIPKPEPAPTPELKPPSAGESFNQRLESLTAQLTGRAGITGERIGTATENYERQLKEINDQLRKNQVEALAAQEKALESGETLGFAAGEAARVQRNFAIEDMRLNIRAQAMQGNIDLAAKTAQRAVDAEFAQTEKDIEIARQNIIKNYDTFTPAEKKRADATLQRLDKDDAFVKEKKEVRKRISDLVIKVAERGGSNIILSQIENATEEEALRIAAPFLKEEEKLPSDIESFKQFFPNVDITTPAGQQQFLDWKAREIAAGRMPETVPTEDGVISPYQTERAYRTIQSVNELLTKAKANPGIFGRTAALPLPQFLRSGAYRNFKSELETLKANIAFGELVAMREASKTGGALGQVSDREGQLLQNALGALNMNQSPKNFQAQLQKINASITRWQNAVKQYGGESGGGNLITAPDGQIIEIID